MTVGFLSKQSTETSAFLRSQSLEFGYYSDVVIGGFSEDDSK